MRPRLLVEELDPRILYAADAAALLGLASGPGAAEVREFVPATQPAAVVTTATATEQAQSSREIIFIDSRVPDAMALADELMQQRGNGHSFEIVLLDAAEDGIAQINRALASEHGLAAIHVISHGSDGAIEIGSTHLDAARLAQDADHIARWGHSLGADGDLLLYGCNVARSVAGQLFVHELGELTGADMAASTNLTGQSQLGGDWRLEYRSGLVEANMVVGVPTQTAWAGLLAITSNSTSTSSTTAATNSLIWAHTVNSGSNSVLFVGLSIDNGATATGVTYGGQAMTLVGRSAGSGTAELWCLVAPALGTANIVVTVGSSQKVVGGAVAFDGVDQTTPTGAFASTGGTSTMPSMNVSSASGDLAIGVLFGNDGVTATEGAGQATQWTFVTGGGSGNPRGVGSTEAGAASVTLSWTLSASVQWQVGGVTIKAAAASAAPTLANLSGDTSAYNVGSAASVIEQGANATVADVDSANFDTGALTVSFAAGGVNTQDVLAVRNQGSGAGQIGVSGANVTYGGTTIGTWAGGSSGSSLVITLNANANSTNTAALIQNITYQNTETTVPSMGARTVRFVLTDGDGGSSVNHDTSVNVTSNTLAVVTTVSDTTDGDTSSIVALNANKGSDGQISLREAILAANNTGGADTINFSIAGTGVHTINLVSVLPTITERVTINATTDDSFAANGNRPAIVLDGNNAAGDGLALGASAGGTTIRGLVIRDFGGTGILIQAGSDNNVIVGNYLGSLTSAGTDAGAGEANGGNGILVQGAGNTIGGSTPADRNVISGNGIGVLLVNGATNNKLQGNLIGLGADGSTAIGNSGAGVSLNNGGSAALVTGNLIGTDADGSNDAAERNVISANGDGVVLANPEVTGNRIAGNLIGTDASGMLDRGNTFDGVRLENGTHANTVGGSNAVQHNVVSGNNEDGIHVVDETSDDNVLRGNWIGVNAAGTAMLGNGRNGIFIVGGADNTVVGGAGTAEGNWIAGNAAVGVEVAGNASGTVIQGNRIGTDLAGSADWGQVQDGIWLLGATGTLVGGTVAGAANVIAFNGSGGGGATYSGISVLGGPGIGNAILGNAIYGNVDLGINLGIQGVTPNDANDADTGPNNLQNFPVLTQATVTATQITLAGSLNSTANSTFRIELFANNGGDASGFGEGQVFIGFVNVATDGAGNVGFSTSLTAVVPVGRVISATATRSNAGYTAFTDTSEFAANISAAPVSPPVNTLPGAQATNEDTTKVFSVANGNAITVSDADAAGADNQVTISVTNGRLTLAGTAGLSFITGDGTADATMTLRGSASAINTALNGLRFDPAADDYGAAVLTLATTDSVLLQLNIDTGLRGRYSFESPASLGADSSPGVANAGSANGVTAVADATRGAVLGLDGNSHVQIAGRFGDPANVTLAAWVNLSAADVGGAEVLSLGDSVLLRLDTGGQLTGGYYNGSTWIGTSVATLLAGTGWHHVAFSFDDSGNRATLFLDGVAVAQTSTTDSINYTLGANSFIGTHGNGAPGVDFTGRIDEARIYNRALSAAEIATLAQDQGMTATNTLAITVAAVNDAPVLNSSGGMQAFVEGMAPVVVDAALTLTDVDTPTLNGATITIRVGYVPGEDVLGFTAGNGITGSWSTATGVLTLSGNASVADYQAALRSVTYVDTSDAPSVGSVTLSFTVRDGSLTATAGRDVVISSAPDTPMANADDGHMQFDGADDVVVVAASGSLHMTSALTLEAWINPMASPNTDRMILNKEGEYELTVFADGSLQYAIALPDNTWDWHNTGAIVSDGRWAHVALSFDNGLIKTYLDGNLVDSFQQAAGSIGDSHPTENELRIGSRTSNPAGHGFAGALDDVRVWNVARSQAEIQAAMTASLSGAEAGLVGWWRFNEAAGALARDASGQGNDGTLANGATRVRQTTGEDTPLLVNAANGVLANDRDGDGDLLTVSALNGNAAAVGVATTLASGAQLTLAANGSYRYDPRGAFDALAAGATSTDSFNYTTTDGNGHRASATVTLVVTGVADAPVITSNGGGVSVAIGIAENTTAVTTVASTDRDGGAPAYSIVAGGDGAHFSIDAATGELRFIAAPDFETPADANGDNVYDLIVQVADGNGGFDTQTLAVTVGDVSGALVVTTTADTNDSGLGTSFTAEQLNANRGSDGAVSLREAIIAANTTANSAAGADTITFHIAGTGMHSIDVLAALPVVTDTLVIDGRTDDSFAANGNRAAIVIDGHGLAADGWVLAGSANGSAVRGLVVQNFGGNGISVLGNGNTLLDNHFSGNGGLGIDLGNDGVTLNDPGDADSGANGLQNFPVLSQAYSFGGNTTLTGTFDSSPGASYRIEFFSSPVGHASGQGEGQSLLGLIDLTTDGSGHAAFAVVLNGVSVAAGQIVSATATQDGGGGLYGSTSEFAANTVVIANTAPQLVLPGAQMVNEDTPLVIPGLGLADSETNLATLRLSVAQGRLQVDLAGGASISAGANASSTLTLVGTQAQIGAALASLAYQGGADFNGSDTLSLLATDAGGLSDTRFVTINVTAINDAPTGLPTIGGSATAGQVLTAQTASLADADGLGAFGYQWLRDGVAIGGATAAAYTADVGDIGSQLSVRLSYTDAQGTAEVRVSAPTASVAAAIVTVVAPPAGAATPSPSLSPAPEPLPAGAPGPVTAESALPALPVAAGQDSSPASSPAAPAPREPRSLLGVDAPGAGPLPLTDPTAPTAVGVAAPARASSGAGTRPNVNAEYLDMQARSVGDDGLIGTLAIQDPALFNLAQVRSGLPARHEGADPRVLPPDTDNAPGSLTLAGAASASGLALTAGTVWWALRAGGLLTSLVVSMPAWRHADLLAVLPDDEDDEDGWDPSDDEQTARDEEAVGQMLDASFDRAPT